MYRFKMKTEQTWQDVLLNSEYFAAQCGFRYPVNAPLEGEESAVISLKARTNTAHNQPNVQYGLMVWHNANYIPDVKFSREHNEVVLTIANEKQMPYPVITRTEAWMRAVCLLLSAETTPFADVSDEERAHQVFIQHLFDA